MYTVWAGGVEVNDYYLTRKEAERVAQELESEGYDDVIIERVVVRLTKKGKRVRALAIALGVTLVYMLSTHIHYTEEGYCWGSFIQCYEGEGKR